MKDTAAAESVMSDQQPTQDAQSSSPFRVLACVNEQPAAQQVLRSAAHMATERKAELYALYVEPPGNSTRSQRETAAQLAQNLRLARDLGAQVEIRPNHRVAAAILQFAHERQIMLIVLGKSSRTGWRLFSDEVVERVRKGSGAIEVHVIE
jgi:K+-sensing histidine kinase KdpD